MSSSCRRTAANRRTFLLSLTTLLLGSKNAFPQTQKDETIRFGLTPVFLNDDVQLLSAITTYLEGATGYKIDLITRRTYQEVTSLLVSGQLDAAWICGYPFVKYRSELELVAVPLWNGKPLYQSYLIAKSDRDASRLSDLRGDIHAFSDPDSNSGYLVTMAMLNENGFGRETFFKKTLFTYSHRNVIRAVASGLVQSGSVDGYVWEVMREIDPDLVARTKIVRKSEWFGFPPIAASKRFSQTDQIKALKKALLASSDTDAGRAMLDYLRLSGFAVAEASLFDLVSQKIESLRGVL
jgi:phosphonate transport system substrate-binding protein